MARSPKPSTEFEQRKPAIRPRLAVAVAAAKLTAFGSRAVGKGGGTALPGLVATRIYPKTVHDLAGQLADGRIAVSGTNGKTTTSRLLGTVLAGVGTIALRNHAGSNLMRGLASSLIGKADFLGRLATNQHTLGLFEVDEAALPEVVQTIKPTTLVLLNLFRDQLDRYGEVATVARLWRTALQRLPDECMVVANGDDPLIVDVVRARGSVPVYFGITSTERRVGLVDHASDVKACPRCGGRIIYDQIFLGHLGSYRCTNCDLARPALQIWASDVTAHGLDGTRFTLSTAADSVSFRIGLPGVYNVYNALAAAATAWTMGVPLARMTESLGSATAAFGRMERMQVSGREVIIALAKNPAGLNVVLRTLATETDPLHLLVMLNDNAADGHDVSWIWDADVEMLTGHLASAVFSGIRAHDMALRFKYASALDAEPQPHWTVAVNSAAALRQAIENTPQAGRLVILPTYTAMLDIRSLLSAQGHVRPYWEE